MMFYKLNKTTIKRVGTRMLLGLTSFRCSAYNIKNAAIFVKVAFDSASCSTYIFIQRKLNICFPFLENMYHRFPRLFAMCRGFFFLP